MLAKPVSTFRASDMGPRPPSAWVSGRSAAGHRVGPPGV
jgi:hypothetical protein